MAIIVNLDIEMAKNKISLTELAERLDMSMTNLSLLKNGRVKGVRFETLNSLCTILNCEVGDILEYVPDSN
ncbi:helix-turn-helix transcriptional regulator [Dysgonomonas sp. HDW5A]|uniref:helix-turn-helix domain-containing protein n=1 Tax=unclassified Dysgonomonas TaxID=2630389 RepID=UPI001408BD08|nr:MULTISPECIES: helix-turn-helix transcriptional regulator [unclassified Dysgonomonas]QIK54879.1 helix-turn-helix transcriptional regulator [Dysgonomonas sp. HDW5B]QIK60309.1 helix-turn-helix transcriptional regulator [Dysgonomonas sp. HDW5A]